MKTLLWELWNLFFAYFARVFRPRECQQWRTALNRGWSWKASTRNIRLCTLSSLLPRWARHPLARLMVLSVQADNFWLIITAYSQTALYAREFSPVLPSVLLFLSCIMASPRSVVTDCGYISTATPTATTSGWMPTLPTSTLQAGARARDTNCTLPKVRSETFKDKRAVAVERTTVGCLLLHFSG